jgi:hypothetical protein
MALDQAFVERNRAATQRMRALAARLTDAQMTVRVGEHWTVSVVFVHLAFWEGRVMAVLDATQRAGKFSTYSIDTIVNDIGLPLWLAIPPREAARIAIEQAEKLDRRLESYPPALLEQVAENNMRYVVRALHRNEHLDELEGAVNRQYATDRSES